MKSNFIRSLILMAVFLPFTAIAEGEKISKVNSDGLTGVVVEKVAEQVKPCTIACAARTLGRFCKNHSLLVASGVVVLAIAGLVAYDLYTVAHEEETEA